MNKYIIVAESGADLSTEMIEQHQIRVAPMHVEVDGKDYLDGSISIADLCAYYDRTKNVPKTSAVSPYHYQDLFKTIEMEDPDSTVIHISYSEVLSSSYQNAILAARDTSLTVRHIDSKNVSIGQAFVVMQSVSLIEQQPDITPDELVLKIESISARTKFFFVPGNLDYLRAGGRVSNAQYLSATLLSIKPLIEVINGEMITTKKYLGSQKKAVLQMVKDFLTEGNIDREQVFFVYALKIDDSLKEAMEAQARELGVKNVLWLKTGAVITSHSGPGGIGIAGIESA